TNLKNTASDGTIKNAITNEVESEVFDSATIDYIGKTISLRSSETCMKQKIKSAYNVPAKINGVKVPVKISCDSGITVRVVEDYKKIEGKWKSDWLEDQFMKSSDVTYEVSGITAKVSARGFTKAFNQMQ
ncbi:hypothetical protein AB4308_17890, partial [Vibrio breoganii]